MRPKVHQSSDLNYRKRFWAKPVSQYECFLRSMTWAQLLFALVKFGFQITVRTFWIVFLLISTIFRFVYFMMTPETDEYEKIQALPVPSRGKLYKSETLVHSTYMHCIRNLSTADWKFYFNFSIFWVINPFLNRLFSHQLFLKINLSLVHLAFLTEIMNSSWCFQPKLRWLKSRQLCISEIRAVVEVNSNRVSQPSNRRRQSSRLTSRPPTNIHKISKPLDSIFTRRNTQGSNLIVLDIRYLIPNRLHPLLQLQAPPRRRPHLVQRRQSRTPPNLKPPLNRNHQSLFHLFFFFPLLLQIIARIRHKNSIR